MTIAFYELDREDNEYEEIARARGGGWVYGGDRLQGIVLPEELEDEEYLLRTHRGPHLLARRVEDE